MPRKKIDDVLIVVQQEYSQLQIVNILKHDRISISQKTASNVRRKINLQRNSVEKIKFSRSRLMATQLLVSKVIKQINVENPPTQCSIAKSCHISQSTISRIIKRSNVIR